MIRKLRKLGQLYFTYLDLADALEISPQSAMVSCSRYVRSGDLIRLKRNYYVLRERWDQLTREEFFVLGNILQVPSYISLSSAMIYYGYSAQIQQDFLESVAVKRGREFHVRQVTFRYTKIREEYFSDFVKKDDFFIATPEKALIDAAHLMSFGRYRLDVGSLDTEKFNRARLSKLAARYPARVRKVVREVCRI